ncbi:MAG TPA: cell division protein [Desulfitobacterium dehalogenans]|uniref:Cell division protein n=1 Tax=Desulfitobacterium dehalogenans TaxID=36854 RepID=A0A7C6Z2M2_9FIRM|nr:cell division protein [Desulfitobacterium dehalogenans]
MRRLFLIFIPLPAIIIGSLAMYINDVSIIIWSQNIFGFIIALLLSYLVSRKPIGSIVIIPISILLLLLTFLDSGFEGVHRWISIGPIRFHIASIVLPILIMVLWRILKTTNWWIPAIISIGVSLLLALQPDASQTTAFIIPMAIILFSNVNRNYFRYCVLGVLSLIFIFSWVYLDALPPVAYVEDIVRMVAEMGIVWFALGITSLVILPLPFILFPPQNSKLLSICIGIYFAIVLISTLFGNFPVPLMGYGISPILGYSIAITWLINAKLDS